MCPIFSRLFGGHRYKRVQTEGESTKRILESSVETEKYKSESPETDPNISIKVTQMLRFQFKYDSPNNAKSDTKDSHVIRLRKLKYILGPQTEHSGHFSDVFNVTNISDNNRDIVCKIIKQKELFESSSLLMEFHREVTKTTQIEPKCQYLLAYTHHFIFDNKYLYLVMEKATGDSLQTRLVRTVNGFSEIDSWKYFIQISQAINHLHQNSIAHRNLKLDNVFIFNGKDGQEVLKVSDYCINRVAKRAERIICYPRDAKRIIYMSPQILKFYAKHLRQKYDNMAIKKIRHFDPIKGDIWALGICLFYMLTKTHAYEVPPDCTDMNQEMATKTKYIFLKNCLKQLYKALRLPTKLFDNISPECCNLLNEILEANSSRRIDHYGIMRHEWTRMGHNIINKLKH